MKPKEQWVTEYEAQRHLPRNKRTLIHNNGSYIEAVQLDAFKAGAEWAAKLCEDQTFAAGGKRDLNEISYDTACIDCQKLIQEEASNLKEIPK